MSLIKSISGIRGTIGGHTGDNLTPIDVVKFVSAFCFALKKEGQKNKVVIGRDARISGDIVLQLSIQAALSMGFDVINLGVTTTPTVEIAVPLEQATCGIIITASHNPKQWNALKLLNEKGEFISEQQGKKVLQIAESSDIVFSSVDDLGTLTTKDYLNIHLNQIINYPLVKKAAIEKANFKIVVDAINSSGAVYVEKLLQTLGVKNIKIINAEMHGNFAHNPEPLEEHLTALSQRVVEQKADMGIAIDPDVDRLCFVSENGKMFGEEYTLVAVADYILTYKKGNTVSNLSSTRALQDVTEQHGGIYAAAKVGEVNVVEKMKTTKAVIGGEGNGGIIVPDFHYGRDALIGIALFLSHVAEKKMSLSALKNSYPNYFMYKTKVETSASSSLQNIFNAIKKSFPTALYNEEDGLKIIFNTTKEWIHVRSSNTEPIIRIYTESPTQQNSIQLAEQIIAIVKSTSLNK